MEKAKKKKKVSRKFKTKNPFPFEKRNYQLFGIGIILLIVGYLFMMQGPADSFWSRTLSPFILVISYCITEQGCEGFI